MMKLGYVSAILPDESLEDVLTHAANIGYECVEIMCWPKGKAARRYAGVTHINVADFGESEAAKVNALCEKYGVSISGLGYYPNALAPDTAEAKQAIDQIVAVIDAAALLNINVMNTFIGRDWTKSVDDNWPRFLETWKPIIQHAEAKNVRVGIENCPMLFSSDEWPGGKNLAHSPAVWRRMFEAIPSANFGLNYDPSHLVWQQMDCIEPLFEFADRLVHVHAKDVRVDLARLNDEGILAFPTAYHTPKLPGMGEVNWGCFFSVLGDVGYRGPVCVEVEDRVFEGDLSQRLLSLQQSHTYLRNYLPRS